MSILSTIILCSFSEKKSKSDSSEIFCYFYQRTCHTNSVKYIIIYIVYTHNIITLLTYS